MAGKFTISTGNGVSASRDKLITYLNTGTSAAPIWSAMGLKVTDSSIEYDWSQDTNTDILGNTFTTARTAQMTQTFSGNEIVGGDSVMNHLADLAIVQKNAALLTNQDLLIVHRYLTDENGNAFAERYPGSSVFPATNGGEGGGMLVTDIDVSYGGERVTGTVAPNGGTVTFTPD